MTVRAVHKFCVTHQQPLLPRDWYDDCIALGHFQPESPFHIAKLDRFWHEARPIAYGAAGSYVLQIALRKMSDPPDLIEVSSYRKRVLATKEGREARYYPTMQELSFDEAISKPELANSRPNRGLRFLISQPRYFKDSVLEQYASAHHRRDILDYLDLAVRLGIIDGNSAAELLAAKHLIPGGVELGVYPRTWLADALSKLAMVGKEFLHHYGSRVSRYDKYQIRAVGFLSERLGSFLLLRHLRAEFGGKIPDDIFGYMTTIVEGNSTYHVGTSD